MPLQIYTYTGTPETFTVPTGVIVLTIRAVGALGGDSTLPTPPNPEPGKGTSIQGDFSVISNQKLTVLVGGAGKSGVSGGGGGGSFVWSGENVPVTLANLLISAGGGGGAGCKGNDGDDGQIGGNGTAGGPGNSGGAGGAGGTGGAAGNANGGSGGFGGGGGGSFNSGINQINQAGVGTGDGYVAISWEEPILADLMVEKEASTEPVNPGQDFTYTIKVTNNGPNDATGVILTDTLTGTATFNISAGGCTV